jgi:GIY-YIG catalytic domain
MNLNDLLTGESFDAKGVLVLRHRPYEPELRRVLPWLAAEKPHLFNAYQQTHGPRVEAALLNAQYVASFIGHEPRKAVFVGLYQVGQSKPLTRKQYWEVPAYKELKPFGMIGFSGESDQTSVLWFDLVLTDFCAPWKGKLVVGWPPPEKAWWRWADRNVIPVRAILEESLLDAAMPRWDELDLSWEALGLLPTRWKAAISQWRGLYYIFDESDGKGYVGSAYGDSNLLGRWQSYASTGHGGNRLLRQRNPQHFRFSILQRVSPDMDADEVLRLECSWKERLHTRAPHGLNDN